MISEPSLPEKVVTVSTQLTSCKLPHAFGGALALAYYAEPRATIDIDLNVFLAVDRVTDICNALAPVGVDTTLDEAALERDGQCTFKWGRTPIDLFFAYDPFHEAMSGAARKVPFADTTIRILSPEHLLTCKAIFDRPKDWIDIEQMMVVADDLDRAEIDSWLARIVGAEHPRKQRFDELADRYLGPLEARD